MDPSLSTDGTPGTPQIKTRTAALSVVSNSCLILLKVAAGSITGSVAILTEAVHSSIDLVASMVAFFSVRKAGEPADESHGYGHEKLENLAAAIEGVLILVGSVAIAFQAIRHLTGAGQVQRLGVGIAVVAFSLVANLIVSTVIERNARRTSSAALEGDAAHLRTDALTSLAVLIGVALVQITGAIEEFAGRGVVGYHELRTRQAAARRYVDLHVQFRRGTSLEDAHRTAHELQDVIGAPLGGADVLIHLEPQDRVRPGEELHRAAAAVVMPDRDWDPPRHCRHRRGCAGSRLGSPAPPCPAPIPMHLFPVATILPLAEPQSANGRIVG